MMRMERSTARRVIVAGTIGNVLEWFDFAIYGYFAAAIGRTFFPHEDPVAQVLAAFGIFAVGFLVRPLGGVLMGHVGDRFGRRAALTISVMAMAIPTFLVGLLPGYAVLGVAAPVILIVLRMIQGLSVGGEMSTSIVFMVEQAPPNRRGLVGAMAYIGAVGGILLGSSVGAVLAALMPAAALEAWGWRIPFLMGLLVGLAGLFVRRHIQERPKTGPASASPFRDAVRGHGRSILTLWAMTVFNAVTFYLLFVYIVSWVQTVDGLSPARALEINSISMLALMVLMLVTGWLSDRVGRRPLMVAGAGLTLVLALPLFWLMHHADGLLVLLGQLGFVVTLGLYVGPQPAAMAESVAAPVRCMTMALGYNMTLAILGGLSPLAAAWLVARTGNDYSPALMVMAAAAVSLLVVLRVRETAHTAMEPA